MTKQNNIQINNADDGYCTELVHDRLTGKERRCKLKKVKNNILCFKHVGKIKQDIKENTDNHYLDRVYSHNLMNLYNSWSEIDVKERIELDGQIWPLSIIINTITQQINNSNMENPYPIYPHNPFTRKPWLPKELLSLKQKIKLQSIPINVSLKLLLEQPEKSINYIYREAIGYLDRHSILLMSLFQQYLRFMTINYKNSQNNYIGFWVQKTQKLTHFEKLYTEFKEIPFQIFNRGNIINNPYREHLKYVLKNYDIDERQPTDEEFCEYLLKD